MNASEASSPIPNMSWLKTLHHRRDLLIYIIYFNNSFLHSLPWNPPGVPKARRRGFLGKGQPTLPGATNALESLVFRGRRPGKQGFWAFGVGSGRAGGAGMKNTVLHWQVAEV
jgi:hypothetical protein